MKYKHYGTVQFKLDTHVQQNNVCLTVDIAEALVSGSHADCITRKYP